MSLFVMDFFTRLLSIIVSIVLNSLLFVGRGLSFIMPDANIVENCQRPIFAYERDLAVSSTDQGAYECSNTNNTIQRGRYVISPVPNTNLLLVLVNNVGEDGTPFKCKRDPYTDSRIGPVL